MHTSPTLPTQVAVPLLFTFFLYMEVGAQETSVRVRPRLMYLGRDLAGN